MNWFFVEMASTATLAIVVFGMILSLMHGTHPRLLRRFAAFLGAIAITSIPDAAASIFEDIDFRYTQSAELIIWTPGSLCVAPLFWMYLFALTSTDQGSPKRPLRHFILPALALVGGLLATGVPEIVNGSILTGEEEPASAWEIAMVFNLLVFQLAIYPQMAVYLFLVLRRMIAYRSMLRDYYASTEQHELHWVGVIGGLALVYWSARTLIIFFAFGAMSDGQQTVAISLIAMCGLALVTALTLYGLRQRPPLVPTDQEPVKSNSDEGAALTRVPEKYERSALTPEASARIARKLRLAMEQDQLHRDANLSLWSLAKHVGASPNYISQTLSEEIGESFFDFVNGYRIAEAKTLLADTEDTVLAITYEVGFNARSSFYNAFKRVTGETPTRYRKTLSKPAGLDDTAA